jgi:hypothetical protein
MSVYSIELLVRLKTVDTIALTAKNTLQKDMGYERTLLDARREEYWLIDVEAGNAEEARKLGREFVTVSKTIVNPNKHTYVLRVVGEEVDVPEKKEPYVIGVLVSYREDEKASVTLDTLRNTLGYGDKVIGVKRGLLWKLVINAEDKISAEKIAEEITVAKSMGKGLLANPHSQTYVIGDTSH